MSTKLSFRLARGIVGGVRCQRRWLSSNSDAVHARSSLSQIGKTRELPNLPRTKFRVWLGVIAGALVWSGFLLHTTNQERAATSIIRQVIDNVRSSEDLARVLGQDIKPEVAWFLLNGSPWISGKISVLKGNIDVSFRLRGSRGGGTVYFTSIRKSKDERFVILRFKVIADDGKVVSLKEEFE